MSQSKKLQNWDVDDKPSKRKLTSWIVRVNIPNIINQYQRGEGAYLIAKSLGIKEDAIYTALRKRGIPIRSQDRCKPRKSKSTCHCGKPALPTSSLCGFHRKVAVAEAAKRYWRRKHWTMAKIKKFDKEQLLKEMARERVGPVKPKRVITPKTQKKPKHKKQEDAE